MQGDPAGTNSFSSSKPTPRKEQHRYETTSTDLHPALTPLVHLLARQAAAEVVKRTPPVIIQQDPPT